MEGCGPFEGGERRWGMRGRLFRNPRVWIALVVLMAGWALPPLWYAALYRPFPDVGAREGLCAGIPRGSVALGLAFWDVRREGRIVDPGAANKHLAGWIHDRRSCLSAILVQESIYVVWEEAGLLREGALEGTPVYRMHRHVKGLQPPVRTLEALACGVGRFAAPPDTLVLVAHDKQIQRALHDLESVYEGAILPARIVGVPYPAGSGGAFAWACRELYVARPLEWLQRAWGGVRCRDRVRLPPLDGRG